MTRGLFLALALAAPPLGAQVAADTGARPIHLAEAIQLAQRNAPEAVQANGQLRQGQTAVRSAWSAFIPNFSVNASSAQQNPSTDRINPTTGVLTSGRWQYTQGLSLSLNIFDGLHNIYSLRGANAQLSAAEAAALTAHYDLAYQVKVQFYAVLGSKELLSAAQSALDQAQQQMEVSRAKMRQQSVTRSDTLRSLVAVGNAQLALLAARNSLQAANASLTRLVAASVTVTASADDTMGVGTLGADSATIARLALAGPLIQLTAANLRVANANASAARSPYLPTIALSYGRNRTAADSNFTFAPRDYSYSGQFRISASYPIFNQWSRESGVVAADVAEDNADATARDARYAVQQTFVQDLGALQTAQQQVAIQIVSVAAAEEDVRVQQERYKLGVAIILDVLTSQNTLNQARAALIQARFNYRVAKAQLEALVGRDL